MRRLITAYDLAHQGRQQNVPEYLITAAGMLRELSTLKDLTKLEKFDAKVEISGAGKEDLLDKENPPPALAKQSDDLFRLASDMGASLDVNVDKLIALAKQLRRRGRAQTARGGTRCGRRSEGDRSRHRRRPNA